MQTFENMIKDFDIKFLEDLRDKYLPMDRESIPDNATFEATMTKEPVEEIIAKKIKGIKDKEQAVNSLLEKKYKQAGEPKKEYVIPKLIKKIKG